MDECRLSLELGQTTLLPGSGEVEGLSLWVVRPEASGRCSKADGNGGSLVEGNIVRYLHAQ